MRYPLYMVIARCGEAYMNCMAREPKNVEWGEKHMQRLAKLTHEHLPHGSGIDRGCTVTLAGADQIRIETSYHHMNEHGSYDGWTEHRITVRAQLTGLKLTISGHNRNSIKAYLHGVFYEALTAEVEEYPQ